MEFIVEVSHPYAADDSRDAQFKVEGAEQLADRLEFLLGWSARECSDIAAELVSGDADGFTHEDLETGRVFTADRVAVTA